MSADTLKDKDSLPFITNIISDKINKKLCKINILKDNFYALINKHYEYITINNDIISYLNNYKKLYHFSKTMNIYEYTKWNKIKLDYINIKKKLTLYKKTYLKIIKNYPDIINYFNKEEVCILDDKINFIQTENQNINCNYATLCQKYIEIVNKRKCLIKNNKVIKIYSSYCLKENIKDIILSDVQYSIDEIIKKIYDLYHKMTQLNKKFHILKSTKSNISNEIMNIQLPKNCLQML